MIETLDTGGGKPYLPRMALLPRPVSPLRAITDLWQFLRARQPHEFVFALLAIVLTGLWFYAIFDKLYTKPEYKPPPVFYATQWPATRTAAEVKIQQAKDLPAELKAKREKEKAESERRAQYGRLAKQFGLD